MSNQQRCYGLESIILHNSFSQVKGRTIKVDCHERTHVGGVNGAGKTSILSLVPAFYGEEPERLVTKASGKLSFVDYYLPSFQSLVIFEYRRQSGMCCSVMYRHSQGKPCYRFVAGGAEDNFFLPDIKELLQAGAEADTVFAALRQRGLSVSKMVDTITNYRAIIQRNLKLIKRLPNEARNLRSLSAEYGLGDSDTHMTHIERLTHVVLNKHRLLSSFKTMICETQFENIHQHTKPKAIDRKDLINDIKSLNAFASEEVKIRDCISKDAERLGMLDSAHKTAANLLVSVDDARETQHERTQEKERLEAERADARATFEENDHQLAQVVNEHKAQTVQIEKQLNALHRQHSQYEEQNLPDKARQFDGLSEYKAQLAAAEVDYASLTSKVTSLETEYEQERQTIQQVHQNQIYKLQKQSDDIEKTKTAAEHEYTRKRNELENQRLSAVSALKEQRANERTQWSDEIVRLETLLQNPAPTPQEQQVIEEAECALEKAEEGVFLAKEQHQAAIDKCTQAKADYQVQYEQVEHLDDRIKQLDGYFNKLQKQLFPAEGTWLAQLRLETPDWGNTLAKIVNPSLLERTDLSARFTEADSETVMGWVLDLDQMPVPEIAQTEEVLQHKLKSLDADRQAAIKSREQAEHQARRLQKIHQELQKNADALAVQIAVAESARDNAKLGRDNAKQRVKNAIAERNQQTQVALGSAEQTLKAFDEDTRQAVQDLEFGFSQQEQELLGHWAMRESELLADLRMVADRIAATNREHEARLEKKRQIHHQKLSDAGVDPAITEQAREHAERLKKMVNQITRSEDEVRAYRKWREQEWSQVEPLTLELNNAQAAWDSAKRQRADAEKRWKEDDAQLKKRLAELTQQIKSLQAMIESAEGVLKLFPDVSSASGFPGNIQDLTEQLQSTQKQLVQLRREVLSTFDQALAILNRFDESQIALAWQKLSSFRRSQMSGDVFDHDDNFKLARIPDLRGLLDTDIPQLKEALVDQFASESGSLEKYFDSLEIMATEVNRVSNVLRQKINTNQQIESLSNIRVVLEPRIYEDAMWQPLKNFVTQWQEWRVLNRKALPNEALIRSFMLVADTLRDARVKDNIESMIDMRLEMKENERHVVIRTDADFLSASSTGLTYLAIMTVFMGLTRYLCPDLKTRITWPIDELGTLSPNNISHLASMLKANNLTMISACPKLDRSLRQFFENKVSLKEGRILNYVSSETTGRYASRFASLKTQGQVASRSESDE